MENRAPVENNFSSYWYSAERIGLIVALLASFVLGLTVAASHTGIPTIIMDLLAISFLTLLPVCAKRAGYSVAVLIAAGTILASGLLLVSHVISGLFTSGWIETAMLGALQVGVIKLASASSRANNMSMDPNALRLSQIASASSQRSGGI